MKQDNRIITRKMARTLTKEETNQISGRGAEFTNIEGDSIIVAGEETFDINHF